MNFLVDPVNFIAAWISQLFSGWGVPADLILVLIYIVGGFVLATVAMLWVTVLIWYERKLIGRIQDRFGPNRVGPWGIFQSIADMLKIFTIKIIIHIFEICFLKIVFLLFHRFVPLFADFSRIFRVFFSIFFRVFRNFRAVFLFGA